MGLVTFYSCLISRRFDDIGKFRKIVDQQYFELCLMQAAESAYLNGMDKEELKEVISRFLGDGKRDDFERICQYYEKRK